VAVAAATSYAHTSNLVGADSRSLWLKPLLLMNRRLDQTPHGCLDYPGIV